MDKSLYYKVLLYVIEKHDKQIRKNCEPYLFHLVRVRKNVEASGYDLKTQIIALLHDVLEDTNATEEELLTMVDKESVECIKALTRSTDNEEEYVNNILKHKMAAIVKSSDIIDNMLSAGALGRDPKYREWSINYINKAEKYYKNKFCKAVDNAISLAKELINNNENLGETIKKVGKIEIE